MRVLRKRSLNLDQFILTYRLHGSRSHLIKKFAYILSIIS